MPLTSSSPQTIPLDPLMSLTPQAGFYITVNQVKKELGRHHQSKAAGPDGLQVLKVYADQQCEASL